MALQQNIAYYCQHTEFEQNVHDQPIQLKQNTTSSKITEKQNNNVDSKIAVKSISTFAGCALILAILALLVAAVAIYLGTRGTDSANFSSSYYLQNISILQEMVLTLQAELHKQDTTITALSTIIKSKGTIWNPVSSCSDIPPGSPSGVYWIQTNGTSNPLRIYCDMNRTTCSCNSAGGWMRVANLDMTDPNQNCPAGLRLVTRTSSPLRTCGRPGPAGCISTTFQTYGVEYSHVCGRVIGYQNSTPSAFNVFSGRTGTPIDSIYVDGVSLTHGQSPRQHIWTFAGALDELTSTFGCPCTQPEIPFTGTTPSYVGQDYFCDTGSRSDGVPVGVFMLMIHFGMVRDVGVAALAVSTTIHHGSASNSLSLLLMISN